MSCYTRKTPPDQAILDYIAKNPGCSGADLRRSISDSAPRIDAAVRRLREEKRISSTNGRGKCVRYWNEHHDAWERFCLKRGAS